MMRKIVIIIICLTISIFINAQSLDYIWAKSAGGSSYEYGESITTDASGDVYATGYFSSASITFGTYTLTSAGSNDIYIVKYDPSGNVLWAKSAGGSGDDRGNEITTDPSGNTYIIGDFNSPSITFGTYTLTSAGSSDIYIVKYNPAGNVLWAKSEGGSSIDNGNDITTDAFGNIYATGYFGVPSIAFGTYTLTSANGGDMYIVKYDSAGNVLWAKSAGDDYEDIGESITADASGNTYVMGTFRAASIAFGTYTLTNSNGFYEDIFIVKYDPSGNVLWAKRAGGTYSDVVRSITTDTFGNLYATGDFSSTSITFGTYTFSNPTSSSGAALSNIYIVKYDPAGNVLWAKNAEGSGDNRVRGITTDASGNAYITGDFHSSSSAFGTNTITNAGGQDIFVAKLSNVHTGNCSCFGLCNGSASIAPTGTAGTYSISLSNGATSTGNPAIFSGLCAGSYSYSITNGTDTITGQFNISQPTALAATITLSTSSICQGSCENLYAMASGGIAPYTYNWSPTMGAGQSINICPSATSVYSATVNDANGCQAFSATTVTIDQTCQDVWPGDANSDGTVDNLDVLELGLHFTQTGPARASASNTWQSYFSNNWTGNITNGKNLNHSDCNGDGTINDDDTLAIYNNYGLSHSFKTVQTTTVNPQLVIVPDQFTVVKGAWGTASIFLGDATNIINNINGVAFTVDFDNTLIETNSIYIEYQNSFLDAGQNLDFRKPDFVNGKIYTATTHTVNNNVSGYGKIATLHFRIKSSLTTDEVLNLGLLFADKSESSGVITPLTAGSGTLLAIGASVGLYELTGNNVSISPNPTNGSLTINSKTELQKIEVVSVTGQVLVSEFTTNVSHTLHLDNFANGIYFVNVYQEDCVVKREKIVLNK